MAARVLVPLATGFEELEAITIIDIIRRADIEVDVAAVNENPVTASRQTQHICDCNLSELVSNDYSAIILPGGLPGADNLDANPDLEKMLMRHYGEGALLGAICAAPKVFERLGFLLDRRATWYPGAVDASSRTSFINNQAVVQDGNVITSRGPGTAMDFALVIVANLMDGATAASVESALLR